METKPGSGWVLWKPTPQTPGVGKSSCAVSPAPLCPCKASGEGVPPPPVPRAALQEPRCLIPMCLKGPEGLGILVLISEGFIALDSSSVK